MTRGLRNNNPLNIRRVVGTVWKGQLAEQNDPEFVQFASIEWGVRAAFKILETYKKKYGAVCISDIVNRWAPPSENDTIGYVRLVCHMTGIGGKERLDERQTKRVVAAMAAVECGEVLSKEIIEEGFKLSKTT